MRNTFARNTATISFFNGLGVASSFAIDVSIAALFGVGSHTDAFFVAATFPLLTYVIFNRVAELALVPIFVSWHERLKQGAWRPFSILLTLTFLGLLVVPLSGLVLANAIFFAIAPGLAPAAHRLTTHLGQSMLFLVPLGGLVALCRAMLNSMKEFSASASSNLLRNLVVLAFLSWALFGVRSIEKAAFGYLFAGVVQCTTLLLVLRRRGFRFQPALDFRNVEVQAAVGATMFPLVSFSLNQSNEIVERILTSFLAPGSLSALVYARRIIAAIVNVFLNSTTSAIIPTLSDFAAREDIAKLQRILEQGVMIILLVALPITTLLLVLGEPLVRIAFLRGVVTETNVQLIANILQFYTMALPFLGLNQLLVAPHYALEDTRTPAVHLLLMILIQLILDVLLFFIFGLFGIPLAMSITGIVSIIRALWLLRRKRISVLSATAFSVTGKLLVASLAMGSTMYLIYHWWAMLLMGGNFWIQVGLTGLIVLSGSIVLLAVAKILGLRSAEFATL